jgi:hypothetical protein
MTSPEPQDWQRRFQDLKMKIDDRTSVDSSFDRLEIDPQSFGAETFGRSYQQSIAWFNSIPSSAKLVAIAGGGLLGLTLIKTVFQLITSLLTLSVLGIILYLVYRFWIAPKGGEG